jgi:hypothetical protein
LRKPECSLVLQSAISAFHGLRNPVRHPRNRPNKGISAVGIWVYTRLGRTWCGALPSCQLRARIESLDDCLKGEERLTRSPFPHQALLTNWPLLLSASISADAEVKGTAYSRNKPAASM